MLRSAFSRRRFMGTMAGAGAAAALPSAGLARSLGIRADVKPNILWLTCEDMSPLLGCYGLTELSTPRHDAFAEEGVVYTNCGGPHAVCSPNRSSIITGMYPTTIGSHHMRCDCLEDPVFAKLMPDYMREAGYFCTNNEKTDYQGVAGVGWPAGGENRWNQCSATAHYKNRPNPSQPFFAVFNYMPTHEHYYFDPANSARAGLTHPPYYPDTDITRRTWEAVYRTVEVMDKDFIGARLDELRSLGLADDTIVFIYSDHGTGLPRAKRWMYDSGFVFFLLVRIPEKFRVDGQGEPGAVNDELVSFIDLAPTVLNLAGVPVPSHMQGRAFLGSNLTPPREYLFGARDRVDERYDIIRAVRDKTYKYIRNYEPWKGYYQWIDFYESSSALMKEMRSLHNQGKLEPAQEMWFAEHKPAEELYDVTKDPHEQNNLASDPQYFEVLARMRKAHEDWVIETRDLGFIPEGELNKRAAAAGSHYKVGTNDNGEAVMRAFDAARLLDKGEDGLQELIDAMDSSDSAVRYWAAIGLGNLLDKASSAKPRLEEALTDSSPIVRMAAARSIAFMGDPDKGVPVLVALTKDTSVDMYVRQQALCFIDRLNSLAKNRLTGMSSNAGMFGAPIVARINATINDEPLWPSAQVPVAVPSSSRLHTPPSSHAVECWVHGRRLRIRATAGREVAVAAYDARGTEVLAARLAPGEVRTVPGSGGLRPGTYLLRVLAAGVRQEMKVIVP